MDRIHHSRGQYEDGARSHFVVRVRVRTESSIIDQTFAAAAAVLRCEAEVDQCNLASRDLCIFSSRFQSSLNSIRIIGRGVE